MKLPIKTATLAGKCSWKLLLKCGHFVFPDVRRKFVFSETYSLLENGPKLILVASYALPLELQTRKMVFVHFYLPQLLWFVSRLSTIDSVCECFSFFLLLFHAIRRVGHKIVLNKNTWPEIVNVFLLIAVSTYSVGKNNKHFMYPVQFGLLVFPAKPAANCPSG